MSNVTTVVSPSVNNNVNDEIIKVRDRSYRYEDVTAESETGVISVISKKALREQYSLGASEAHATHAAILRTWGSRTATLETAQNTETKAIVLKRSADTYREVRGLGSGRVHSVMYFVPNKSEADTFKDNYAAMQIQLAEAQATIAELTSRR